MPDNCFINFPCQISPKPAEIRAVTLAPQDSINRKRIIYQGSKSMKSSVDRLLPVSPHIGTACDFSYHAAHAMMARHLNGQT
jgi:hypothetical protein